jgi:hypothetical protein
MSRVMYRTLSAEFPNDNDELHAGAIWRVEEPCGQLEAIGPLHAEEVDDGETVEVVETIDLGEPLEVVPAPTAPPVSEVVLGSREAARPACGADAIDAYRVLLRTLAEVARALGAPLDAAGLERALEGDPVARAWAAILHNESEDFSLCTTTLDEWAAGTLVSLADAPSKLAVARRELRARGVAAFGLAIEAA